MPVQYCLTLVSFSARISPEYIRKHRKCKHHNNNNDNNNSNNDNARSNDYRRHQKALEKCMKVIEDAGEIEGNQPR